MSHNMTEWTIMKTVRIGLIAVMSSVAMASAASDSIFHQSNATELSEFQWTNRPIVVFSDSPNDPNFIRQLELLREEVDELEERDVVVLTDTDPSVISPLREKLRPRGFMMVLIGKDGEVKLRKPFPWSVREISRAIDKMPMRQQEMRNR